MIKGESIYYALFGEKGNAEGGAEKEGSMQERERRRRAVRREGLS